MDMTLYALLMKKLQGQKECLTWNGNSVEVVDAIPESPLPNTIYFVKSDILATTKIPTDESEAPDEGATDEGEAPDDLEGNEVVIARASVDVVELKSENKKKTSKKKSKSKTRK